MEVVRFALTQYLNTCFTDKPDSLTSAYFPILSEKQDSNLQPLASKASKQPIVIFPEFIWVFSGFEPCSSEPQSGILPVKLKTPFVEPIRIERIPVDFQSTVHTCYTIIPLVQEEGFEPSKFRS